ncbi:hypothetical protein AB0I10_39490 [Streptomyces sp. NPDC050636]
MTDDALSQSLVRDATTLTTCPASGEVAVVSLAAEQRLSITDAETP